MNVLKYFILFSILLFLFSCSNNNVKPEDLIENNGITLLKSNNSPFTGVCSKYNKNKKIEFEKNYINGKLDGEFIRYFENGNISSIVTFINSKPAGYKQFYESNKIKAEKTDDGKTQILTTWFENGNKQSVQHFYNNMLNGKSEQWYDNGKIEFSNLFKQNKQYGKFIVFHKNGKIKIAGNYINGEFDGNWKTYNENEQVLSNENYNLGKKVGSWTYYFDNGSKKAEIVYKNGLIKENKEWNEKGRLINSFSAE